MNNWRKVALVTVGALALFGLAGAVAFHTLVDPERIERIAREKVAAATGRTLEVGTIGLRLFPSPSLHAENIVLGPPPGGKNADTLKAASITARLSLLPLLTGKARIKGLDLDGVQATLDARPEGAPAPAAGGKDPLADLLEFTSLRITDSDLLYRQKGAAAVSWHVVEATVEGDAGLRDVVIEASLERNHRPMQVKASFAELARAGKEGAVSQGKLEASWGGTQLALEGRLPLSPGLKGHDVGALLTAQAKGELFTFFGSPRRLRAPLALRFRSTEAQGIVSITALDASLGKLKVTGEAQWHPGVPKPLMKARLALTQLDWAQATLDAGEPPVPALEPEELFHSTPLAWPMLVDMKGRRAEIDATLSSLRLRNGVELRNVKAIIGIDDDRLDMRKYTVELLGGQASGSMRLEGRTRLAKVEFDGAGLVLERWFKERGSMLPFTGGPMKVRATFTATGANMKELASTATGPVTIRMGPGVFSSPKAGSAESKLMSSPDTDRIDFQCVGAWLPFLNGRASSQPLLGAKSAVSNLLTSGFIDLRSETLELRGRMKPRSGGGVTLAALAGDIEIAGPIRYPKVTVQKPAAVARVGAAIATLGLSAVGTAIADAGDAQSDPCEMALDGARTSAQRRSS